MVTITKKELIDRITENTQAKRLLVSGTGTVSFYWMASSEGDCDYLEFYIDGVLHDRISGSADWHQMTYTIKKFVFITIICLDRQDGLVL